MQPKKQILQILQDHSVQDPAETSYEIRIVRDSDFDSIADALLKTIQIPDAAVLRDKMQEILELSQEWDSATHNAITAIAREALSQAGDGWIRCEDGLPESGVKYLVKDFNKDYRVVSYGSSPGGFPPDVTHYKTIE